MRGANIVCQVRASSDEPSKDVAAYTCKRVESVGQPLVCNVDKKWQ